MATRGTTPSGRWLALAGLMLLGLAFTSLFIGASEVTLQALLSGDRESWEIFAISRVPRTLALILAGIAMAVAGLVMQMLARNRFVEPSTVGTVEAASLGVLVVALLAPDLSPLGKMLVSALFALAGTALFLAILRRIPLRTALIVPLVGLVLAGVIDSVTTFFAYRYDLLQSLRAWTVGDFSGVLRGRYELLWVSAALTAATWFAADRFTVAGMGEAFTTNLGLNHRRLVAFGLIVVALVTASVVATVGVIPFLGLIVPNVVSLIMGDHMRRSIPWVAVLGAGFVLGCDILGRVINRPYEIPIGTMMGILGSAIFIMLLLRKRA